MTEITAHVPILADVLTKTQEYTRLHTIMADKWNLTTIFEDWEKDFPSTIKPARSWKAMITSLVNMFLEGGDATKAVQTAFSEGPEDTPFPFGVDLDRIGMTQTPDLDRIRRTQIPTRMKETTKGMPFCTKCGKDTRSGGVCAFDGKRHEGTTPDMTGDDERIPTRRLCDDNISTTTTIPDGSTDDRLATFLQKVGGQVMRYADALERCGFSDPNRLEGVSADNLLGWVARYEDMTPGDAVAITKAAKKVTEKRKDVANPDNEFDARNFPDKLKKAGPCMIVNTMYRMMTIGSGGVEKKRLFTLFEHWLKILDKAVKAGKQDGHEELIGHGQEIINSIRAIDANAQGKPGSAILAQVEARTVKDEFGAAVATWEAKGPRRIDRHGPNATTGKRFMGTCFGCGKQGHRQSECRNARNKGEFQKRKLPQQFPSQRASGGAGL